MPAAAVRRGMQALSGIIGRKASEGGFLKSTVKAQSSTLKMQSLILNNSSLIGVEGILGGVVKCADIEKNTGGRKRSTGSILTLMDES